MPTTWIIADTHFGHNNIIRYCNRPFISVQEMDDVIINNINRFVAPNDILYHLGDFAFTRGKNDKETIKSYRDRIICKNVFLIAGNHDPHNRLDQPQPWLRQIFNDVYIRLRLKFNINNKVQHIIMDHYAGRVWNGSHHGSWQLRGHSHYTLPDLDGALQIDVGVDAVAGRATGYSWKELVDNNLFSLLDPREYRPISLGEISAIITEYKNVHS